MASNKKSYLTPLTIIAVCCLALGPLATGFFGPDWRARWLLAWAANEYQNGAPQDAEQTLDRAVELSSGIATDVEFWNLKFDLVFNKEKPSRELVSKLLEESKSLIGKLPEEIRHRAATYVGQLFHMKKEHGLAVEIVDSFCLGIAEREPNENNGIAYFRSLAKTKLDIALNEIDAALVADGTSRDEFLDTKAWVLHGLNRDKEAILFAEEAIKRLRSEFKYYKPIPVADRAELLSWLFPDSLQPQSDAPEPTSLPREPEVSDAEFFDLNPMEKKPEAKGLRPTNRLDELRDRFPHIHPGLLDELAKKVASLRFHRACILDELGRNQEANLDYAWLDLFGFTDTTNIF